MRARPTLTATLLTGRLIMIGSIRGLPAFFARAVISIPGLVVGGGSSYLTCSSKRLPDLLRSSPLPVVSTLALFLGGCSKKEVVMDCQRVGPTLSQPAHVKCEFTQETLARTRCPEGQKAQTTIPDSDLEKIADAVKRFGSIRVTFHSRVSCE